MSVTDVKTTTIRKAKKTAKPTKAEREALKSALDAAPIEYEPLSSLTTSPYNVRVIPYPDASVRSMATSINAVGLLQNLVVHTLPDGKSGVAAGGRRLAGLNLLVTDKEISSNYLVPVKRVCENVARLVSFIENEEHLSMHPAEQIYAFRDLSAQGVTPAHIGAQLGYSSRHVNRMLKLAGLAPELLAQLAKDEITIEQCQALALETDPARQLQIFERVKSKYGYVNAHVLKREITDCEVSVRSPDFEFIGREAYEAAGGIVREDLFSEEEESGTADKTLLENLVREKLTALANDIQQHEGWAWSQVRDLPVRTWGVDAEMFQLTATPGVNYTSDEQQRLDELYATRDAAVSHDDEYALQALIDEIEDAAVNREWTSEQKAQSGVVVCWYGGDVYIQRGVRRITQEQSDEVSSDQTVSNTFTTKKIQKPVDTISVPLLKKMSSERTLAVQAALIQQPEKTVSLMVWKLCSSTFTYCNTTRHPFEMSLNVHHSALTSEAPTGKSGRAWLSLMQEKARLEALLPEGWEKDFTTFFTLDGQTLMSLMVFCTACSVDGVQSRTMGHTTPSTLDGVETAIGFHLRDWWQPTVANFLGMLSKKQIVESLTEAGLTGAASDAEKMKKGDAASHAEQWLSATRWVPGWMQSPDAVQPDVADGDAADTNEHTAHAA